MTALTSLHRFDSGSALLEHAGAFLREKETLHSLQLVLASRVPDPAAPTPYYASVDDGAGIVLVALRTPPHNLVLSALRDPAAVAALDVLVDDLSRLGHSLNGAHGHAPTVRAFAERWAAAKGLVARPRVTMTAYELERVAPPAWPPGRLRRAGAADVDRLADWSLRFIDEAGLPPEDRPFASRASLAARVERGALHVWEVDGQSVTMAAIASQPVPRIGSVYTPPEHRRRGYASAIVAKLSENLLAAGGRVVTLSADAANPTSNAIYQRLGYRPVGEELMMAFAPSAAGECARPGDGS